MTNDQIPMRTRRALVIPPWRDWSLRIALRRSLFHMGHDPHPGAEPVIFVPENRDDQQQRDDRPRHIKKPRVVDRHVSQRASHLGALGDVGAETQVNERVPDLVKDRLLPVGMAEQVPLGNE